MYLDPSGFISETWKNILIGPAVILTLALLTCLSAGTLSAGGAAFAGALLGSGVQIPLVPPCENCRCYLIDSIFLLYKQFNIIER